MPARDINDLPIPYQRYLLSFNELSQGYLIVMRIPAVNDLAQGYLMLLSEPAQWNAASIAQQLNPPAKIQHSVADGSSSTTRFTISFSCPWSPRPRPRPRLHRRQVRGESTGHVLHRRRWVQEEGSGCDAEIEAASAFPGHSLT